MKILQQEIETVPARVCTNQNNCCEEDKCMCVDWVRTDKKEITVKCGYCGYMIIGRKQLRTGVKPRCITCKQRQAREYFNSKKANSLTSNS